MFQKSFFIGTFLGVIILFVSIGIMIILALLTAVVGIMEISQTSTERTRPPEIQITVDHSLPILLPECARNITRALATHLDFQIMGSGDRPVQGRIVAMNDVLCEEPERMANLAIIAMIESGAQYYARSHFHFLDNGDLASTYTEQWKRIYNANDWKAEWCEFIQFVYPTELAVQECTLASE